MRCALIASEDLTFLLAHMAPALHPQGFLFRSLPEVEARNRQNQALGWFREAEGVTLILPAPPGAEEWACITLTVHSALTAVGFLAAIARRLAEAGVPLNVVSAVHHDHLFVPWERRESALQVLQDLIREAGQSSASSG